MLNSKMRKLFESDENTGLLPLKKTELDDANLIKHLSVKPTEINIILARVASFVKGDAEKTKKDLINDILEVLERSAIAREFVGIGVQQEYRLYKGFPVRKGDPYESMADPGTDMNLKPSELYIGWMTDGSKAREDSIRYDAAKGEPIGGLLVDVHIDITKILFDINAVIRTVKAKKGVLDQYNSQAAPGKSLSKTNIDFLATQAPLYYGMWEIITTNKVTTVRIMDKWTWDTTTGQKKVKWETAAKQQTAQNENIRKLFESIDLLDNNSSECGVVDESLWQGIKNVFGSLFGTTRMKNVKKLTHFIRAHDAEKHMYSKLGEFFKLLGNQPERVKEMEIKVEEMDDLIRSEQRELEILKNELQKKYAENPAASPTEASTDAEKKVDALTPAVKAMNKDSGVSLDDMEKRLVSGGA